MTSAEAAAAMAPQLLAYIGDAVFELHVRQRLLGSHARVERLHKATVDRVRAEHQALLLEALKPHLRPDEADVVRRGRNAKTAARHRDLYSYRYATAFECLIGYLHLGGNQERLTELWELLDPLICH